MKQYVILRHIGHDVFRPCSFTAAWKEAPRLYCFDFELSEYANNQLFDNLCNDDTIKDHFSTTTKRMIMNLKFYLELKIIKYIYNKKYN